MANVAFQMKNQELSSCQSLSQETRGDYSGETCCGSRYTALVNLIDMFAAVIEELDVILKDVSFVEDRVKARILLSVMLTFDFIFSLHLLKTILGITNELSLTLQTRDNGTVNAMEILEVSKRRFLMMRESGWTSLLDDISSFCAEFEIDVPNMDDLSTANSAGQWKDVNSLLSDIIEQPIIDPIALLYLDMFLPEDLDVLV
ncbi:hypothetical protein RHMOL_Rhmol07G0251500 [Rhododendron molle]|uniref:Uncharacterized protein n=1 Tax=Rhododendron molle TaxID=49168 RepID=A0ACC0N4A6_RHOML|nr:hypothetical protein RHMOL_Rhmol07G0251500 [Rhododendron molle]